MRIFKVKALAKFARQERITDASLKEAILRAESGHIDADLGGGLIKQRVARPGRGRSGGYRVIVAYRAQSRSVILFGFAKNERGNIARDELLTLREIATDLLRADDSIIGRAIKDGVLQEIEE